jgi:hypothetical protein
MDAQVNPSPAQAGSTSPAVGIRTVKTALI